METAFERTKHLLELRAHKGYWKGTITLVTLSRIEYIAGPIKYEVARIIRGIGGCVVCLTTNESEAENIYNDQVSKLDATPPV